MALRIDKMKWEPFLFLSLSLCWVLHISFGRSLPIKFYTTKFLDLIIIIKIS